MTEDLPESARRVQRAIDYEFGGTRYRETGTDLLAFAKVDGHWRVWWRTVIPGTSETE